MGEGTADQIAKAAKLNRSTTYVQIKDLMADGLVTTYKKGKKTFFAAKSPNRLENILEWRRKELEMKVTDAEKLMPELMKVFKSAGSRPTSRVFEGKQGLISMRNEILKTKPEELLIMTNYDRMRSVFTADELKAFTQKRERLKIVSRIMYTSKKEEEFSPYKRQHIKRLSAEESTLDADIYIYDTNVSFASCEDSIMGLIVSSPEIANTMRFMFWNTWGRS